ncbi:MAG: ComEC/Rec2 family competence protein [Neomegalonema sp.]|nr:ComEC/Rec2 family competence protein [Neomegalonema sp.]
MDKSVSRRAQLMEMASRHWREAAARQERRGILWAPVALGLGIWIYFALPFEPAPYLPIGLLLGIGAVLASFVAVKDFRANAGLRFCLIGAILVALGFAAAQIKAMSMPQDRLGAPWQGALSGRVLIIDRTQSGALRLTLDRVSVEDAGAKVLPTRVRIALSGRGAQEIVPTIGARVRLHAWLGPPPGPSEPGGFDFRRVAYFDRLGAVGYAREALEILGRDPVDRLSMLRAQISTGIRERVPDQAGAIIAALLVGDRAWVERETYDDLRASNLAHLLAISGMHIGMVCMTIFVLVRVLFALSTQATTHVSGKKVAAIAALLVGLAYVLISGGSLATQRAFIMAMVAFGAVLVDRPAVTMRAVALAALIILIWQPQSLFNAGFQLSFAATLAMVAFFEASRSSWPRHHRRSGLLPKLASGALMVLATSAIAGLATAPIAAAVFNRISTVGLPANLIAVPLMGIWVMPMGLLAALLTPLGLEAVPLKLMAEGVKLILLVARQVAALPGAVMLIPAIPALAQVLLIGGGLWLCLMRGGLRWLAFPALIIAVLVWQTMPRPDLLIAPGGRLVGGLYAEPGAPQFERRWLDRARGQSYTAALWLRRDGDAHTQEQAAIAAPVARDRLGYRAALPDGWTLQTLLAKEVSADEIAHRCAPRTLILLPRQALPGGMSSSPSLQQCLIYDRSFFSHHGPMALHWPRAGERPQITAPPRQGWRLWNRPTAARPNATRPNAARPHPRPGNGKREQAQ